MSQLIVTAEIAAPPLVLDPEGGRCEPLPRIALDTEIDWDAYADAYAPQDESGASFGEFGDHHWW